MIFVTQRRSGESRHVDRVRFKKALLEARMALADDRPAPASRHLARARTLVRDPGSTEQWSEHVEQLQLVAARLALAEGCWDEVQALAGGVSRSAMLARRWYHWVEAEALATEYLLATGQLDTAEEVLRKVLAFAADESLWRPFFYIGPRLREHVAALGRAGVAPAVALDTVLSATAGSRPAPKCDPLHARETQILSLVAEGVKNREIGERLFLSEETVKWYLKSLYRKLEVGNRTAAVARARELGLLEPA
ncbi:MAG: LuxR C-terminal-related transcriptional regulator [Arhodomonas sp.]|nr:LuxR C-terminal-related transcriptional regulator [Arhodomonas sp.]